MRTVLGVPAMGRARVPGDTGRSYGSSECTAEGDAVVRGRGGEPGSPVADGSTVPELSRNRSGVPRRWVIRRGSAVVSPVLAALLLASCGSEAPAEAPRGTAGPSSISVEPPAPATSEPADPTDGAADDEPDGQASGGAGSSGQTRSSHGPRGGNSGEGSAGGKSGGGSNVGGSGGGTEDPSGSPPELTPVHGGRAWAVYLAVGSPDSDWEMDVLAETESYVRGLGYVGSGIGSVGCDQGAAEALGYPSSENRVAVYFDSAARAKEFVAVYDRPDLGTAQVTTYCLD